MSGVRQRKTSLWPLFSEDGAFVFLSPLAIKNGWRIFGFLLRWDWVWSTLGPFTLRTGGLVAGALLERLFLSGIKKDLISRVGVVKSLSLYSLDV